MHPLLCTVFCTHDCDAHSCLAAFAGAEVGAKHSGGPMRLGGVRLSSRGQPGRQQLNQKTVRDDVFDLHREFRRMSGSENTRIEV